MIINPISPPNVERISAAKKLTVPLTINEPTTTISTSLGEGGKRFSINGIRIIKL